MTNAAQDLANKKTIIRTELSKRIRVVVIPEEFTSGGEQPHEVFSAYEQTDGLSIYSSVTRTVEQYSKNDPNNFKDLSKQLADIQTSLEQFVDRLAKNALIGSVDLSKVDPKIFEKQARFFENAYKSKLVLTSPSFYI